MECMRDTVGLAYSQCKSLPSLTGLYLDQLPGIQLSELDGVASSDQITALGLWEDLQTMAIETFKEDVIAEFGKRYQLRQILQTVDLGKNIDIVSLTAPIVDTKNGILLETYEPGSQCIGSSLMGLYVQDVNFYFSGTTSSQSFTLTFQDADTLNIEYTVTTNGISGWNNVWIDKSFNARRLNILVDGNFDNYVGLDISNFFLDNFSALSWNSNFSSGALNISNRNFCGINSRLRGLSYDTTTNTPTTGQNTYGLSIRFSTKCTWDAIVCSNKRAFASAWQHCLAAEFLNYRIYSERLNKYTTIKLEDAKRLQKVLSLKYRGGVDEVTGMSYPGKLKNAIESLVLNQYDGCIKMQDMILNRETRL